VHDEIVDSNLLEQTFYVQDALTADSLEPVPSIPLASGRHDVVHAHFGPNARRFLFAREQARAPLVVTFHGYDFSSEPAMHGASMYERLFEVADAVTFNCEHARLALERLGCPQEKLRPLRMPVEVETLPFRERQRRPGEPVRFLSVGRLVEKKGHEIALRALAAARPSLPDLRYDIVGGGPLADRLERLVRDLGLSEVVHLHGMQDSAFVRGLLADAHVFVLASATASNGDQEGTPVALMEAQACGLPVVSTLHSGIPEVVLDGRTGLLVPEGDPDALADALIRIAREPESWPRLGAAGRAHVETTFDMAKHAEQLLAVYRFTTDAFTLDK
jgi:colanic acid/amylovoran biosynthesis glycosyltransferase